MTLDGITLAAIVRELKQYILQAKIEKVQQPERDEIVLQLHTQEGKKRLLISSNAGDCRINLTTFSKPNPKSAPMFCMFLRKHLTSGRIIDIAQVGLERIVRLRIEGRDELGVLRNIYIVAELMGKHSNIIILDENEKVMDSLRRVSVDVSSIRQILPGIVYTLPPLNKANPLEQPIALGAQGSTKTRLIDCVQGMSSAAAAEIIERCGKNEDALTQTTHDFIYDCIFNTQPCLQLNMDGKPAFYSALPYKTYSEQGRVQFLSINQAIDEFYKRRYEINILEQKKQYLNKLIKKNLTKILKKAKHQQSMVSKAQNYELMRQYGDTITANMYILKKGMDILETTNCYTNEPVSIPLDITYSPSANAQAYYKKYNKFKTALQISTRQYEECMQEIEYLEQLSHSIDICETLNDLDYVRLEMEKQGYVSAPSKAKPKKLELSLPYEFKSSEGCTIYAGKNSKQNDTLTMKVATGEDMWLHTKDIAGSHVIIVTNGKTLGSKTLFEAATIAATLSKAHQSGKIPVDCTQRKNVRKPNGARPGMVIYDNYNTFMVFPDKELLDSIKVKR